MREYDEIYTFEKVFGFEFGDDFITGRTINLGLAFDFFREPTVNFKLYNRITKERAVKILVGQTTGGITFVPRKFIPKRYTTTHTQLNSLGINKNDYIPTSTHEPWWYTDTEAMLPGEKYMLGMHTHDFSLGITFRWREPRIGVFNRRGIASINRVKTSRGWELQYLFGKGQ